MENEQCETEWAEAEFIMGVSLHVVFTFYQHTL